MAPLLKELSSLEIQPLETVVDSLGREGFYAVRSQDSSLYRITAASSGNVEIDALLIDTLPNDDLGCCCCICCPCV